MGSNANAPEHHIVGVLDDVLFDVVGDGGIQDIVARGQRGRGLQRIASNSGFDLQFTTMQVQILGRVGVMDVIYPGNTKG